MPLERWRVRTGRGEGGAAKGVLAMRKDVLFGRRLEKPYAIAWGRNNRGAKESKHVGVEPGNLNSRRGGVKPVRGSGASRQEVVQDSTALRLLQCLRGTEG